MVQVAAKCLVAKRVSESELSAYIFLYLGCGGGGKGGHRDIREALRDTGQAEIIRPEVMAPLRYAVGLVYGKKGDGNALQCFDETWHGKAFRGDVEQFYL